MNWRELRVGQGFDIHAFAEGRPLRLGGVEVPHKKGLDGHSDADVLLHAICDALLGAAGLSDIGQHFPPTDPQFKNIDSMILLQRVVDLVIYERRWRLLNLDCVLMVERPKVNPHIGQMKKNISAVIKVSPEQIGIKATTTEKLGFVGREEGIAASAVCLLGRT